VEYILKVSSHCLFRIKGTNLHVSVVGLVHDTSTVLLTESVSRSIRFVTAADRIINTPILDHLKSLSVPNVAFHPGAAFLLSKLV